MSSAIASKLSDEKSRTSKICHLSYNAHTGILIVNVKLNSVPYALAIRSFDLLIAFELSAMNIRREVKPYGSVTTTIGNWTKEPDCSWSPAKGRINCVVEVGLSESTRHLSFDARYWLETHSSSVELVVTITVNRDHPEIIFNRWGNPWKSLYDKSFSKSNRIPPIISDKQYGICYWRVLYK